MGAGSMNTKELIKSVQAAASFTEEGRVLYEEEVILLINEAMENQVIVPVELILNIDLLTEAGFSAEEQIDELCELLVQDGDSHES